MRIDARRKHDMANCKSQEMLEMAGVLTPAKLNERFTVYLNTESKPVERTLREMSADEVLSAINWHVAESRRLDRETHRFTEMAKIIEDGGALPAEITSENLHQASMELRQAGEAGQKAGRLMVLVVASIQQTHRQHGMKLGEAVRRFWPGCQAA
jgi:glutamine synthetase type III